MSIETKLTGAELIAAERRRQVEVEGWGQILNHGARPVRQ